MKLENLSKSQLIEKVKKLQMSDERFHSLVEHTSDSIFCYEYNPPISIDLPFRKQIEMLYDGILVECNDLAAKSYGYNRASEVLGKSLLELFKAPPGSLDDFFGSFIENGYRTVNAEAQEILEDGSKRYFLNNGHAAIKNGYIERVWGTYREITELKKAEEALRKNEALYSSILKVAPIGIGMVVDRVFRWVSERFIEMVGYTEEEILGKSTRFIYSNDEEFKKVGKIRIEEIKKQGYGEIDTKFQQKDGKVIDIDLRFIALDPTDLSAGVIFTALDITDRKEFVEKLRENEEKYRKLITSMTEGVWVTDLQDKTILVNPALEKILGYSQDEFLGRSVIKFLTPESKSVLKAKRRERYIDKKPSDTYELTFMHKNGNLVITRVAATSILNERMIPIGSFGVISDITAQKLVEKERLELEERRNEFMSITSHELRTPLTNIRGFIELLSFKEKSLSIEDQMKCLDIALRNITRLERLISGVSTLTQIERGVLHLEFEPKNMCDFLDNLLLPYRMLHKNQIHFSCQCDSLEYSTSIDPNIMGQAIENILQNAIKQTDNENRQIEVTCTIISDSIQISVSDNGAGIKKNHHLRIFDSFVSIPTKYSAQGTGIGLYLAKTIIEAHKGRIRVLSEGLNQGATFIIDLPLSIN